MVALTQLLQEVKAPELLIASSIMQNKDFQKVLLHFKDVFKQDTQTLMH